MSVPLQFAHFFPAVTIPNDHTVIVRSCCKYFSSWCKTATVDRSCRYGRAHKNMHLFVIQGYASRNTTDLMQVVGFTSLMLVFHHLTLLLHQRTLSLCKSDLMLAYLLQVVSTTCIKPVENLQQTCCLIASQSKQHEHILVLVCYYQVSSLP